MSGASRLARAALAVLVAAVASPAAGREYALQIVVDSPEELYQLAQDGDLDASSVETLVALMDHPLDLNRADRGILYDLPGVTNTLAEAIVAFRASHGPIASIDELMQVPGMTQDVLDQIVPFVTTGPVSGAHGAARPVRGRARLGTVWLAGVDKKKSEIDPGKEHIAGPQSYLRLSAAGFGFDGGVLGTYRQRTVVRWDLSRSGLVSDGPGNRFDLDQAYLAGGTGPVSVLVGSYVVGFGERLTFNTAASREPSGFYEYGTLQEDNRRGRLAVPEGLFGAVASAQGVAAGAGWVSATAFASRRKLDIYQDRNIWYRLDDISIANGYGNGSCPTGYAWDDALGFCHSTVVTDIENQDLAYRYITFKDAMQESLFGGNVDYAFDETSHVGVTGYQGRTDILIATEARPIFSPAAKYPESGHYGAAGINGRTRAGPLELSGEWAYTGGGGHGAYARAIWDVPKLAESTLALRYYDGRYENPHGNGESARDQELGLSARNEMGGSLQSVVTPMSDLRLVADFDLSRDVQRRIYEAGQVKWRRLARAPLDLLARVRGSYRLTSAESASLLLEYNNKDLATNGRGHLYEFTAPDSCYDASRDYDYWLDNCVRQGERRKVQLGASTARLPGARFAATYTLSAQDVVKRDRGRTAFAGFEYEQRIRARVSLRAWPRGALVAAASYWFRQIAHETIYGRQEPTLDAFVDVTHDFGVVSARVRWGTIYYRSIDGSTNTSDRYSWYQLAKVAVEGRF